MSHWPEGTSERGIRGWRDIARWIASCLLAFTGDALANTPLDDVLRQLEQMRGDYEKRLSRLEQEKQSDHHRIAELERQKQADGLRIQHLEQALNERKQKEPAVARAPLPSNDIEHVPTQTARTRPESAAPQVKASEARPVDQSQSEPPESSSLNLKGKGAQLIDERNGSPSFSLNAKVSLEGRYSYFGRTDKTWQPNNLPLQPINDYSIVELNRAMLAFTGHAFRPELVYSLMMYASTSSNSVFPLGYIGYDWMPEVRGRVGIWKAPGTREWTESWTSTLGADRTRATTYFRPNWTPGAWLEGTLEHQLNYTLFVGNSFGGSSGNYSASRLGTGMLYGSSVRWEPDGPMGDNVSDLQDHSTPVWGLGGTAVYQNTHDDGNGSLGNPDSTIFRVSNGTPLSSPGALGLGNQITSTDVTLATIDTGFKYAGFALFAEFEYRHLGNFGFSGAPPEVSELHDFGGIFQGSYFLLPKSVEVFGRSSIVRGRYATPWEAGGGFNWYPVAMVPNWIMTAEALYIKGSPAENLLTPYRAGESGVAGMFEVKFFF
jgi:hypothetical protein